MTGYLLRRIAQMVPILLGVALLTFVLFHGFAPDPVRAALGQHASPEAMAALQQRWGLDQPLSQQFLSYLGQIVSLNFGNSLVTDEPVGELIAQGAWVSLAVTGPPFIAGQVISIAMALFITYHQGGWVDRFARGLFVAAMSVSALVYVLALQYLLAFKLGWFPISGFERGLKSIVYLLLPWLILLAVSIGPDIRLYRGLMVAEAGADHVRTARSKGASESRVLIRHILPNAAIPIITNTVMAVPFLVLGSLLLERFFSIPGIGDLVVTSLGNGDFPVLKAITILSAMALVIFNLLADLLYAWVDPRVRLS
jgi:peptide/nickel transport system permease protein